jgi:two-component system sensor histidine kinase BaeS
MAPGPRPDGPRRPGEDGPGGLYRRLGLEDAQGQPLAGEPDGEGRPARRALHDNGELIGHLTLAPTQVHDGAADQAFLRRHLGFVAWTGLAGLLLALLLSWWLTRRWLAPVDALADGAREIAQGRLATRVPVAGDGELGTLARSFNDMAQRLEALESSRREWLANVAHELRTPLAAMRAEIEALQDGIRSFDDKAALRLHRQVMRLIQLVNDLRASMDAPGASHHDLVVPVHALALLGEAAAGMRERFTQAGLSLDTEPIRWLGDPHAQPCVGGEPDALHQVFVNLLENCLRYTDNGGRVVLSHDLRREDGERWLVLHFDDSAPGVPTQDLERIFERLYRGDSSRSRSHGGSGLGLPICRHLLQAQGGRIDARASLLGGLRVSVMLPLLENPA